VDPGCTVDNCVATVGCETATCVGDDCVRTPGCGLGEMCCSDACVAEGCDDGLGCTEDRCGDSGCINRVATGCVIDDACVADGAADPDNECLMCDPAARDDDWSARVASVCDDGLYCTIGDECSAEGSCVGRPRPCSDGLLCTSDFCDEDLDSCDASVDFGCVIGGRCLGEGVVDETNACRACNHEEDAVAWSARVGVSCDDGRWCTLGEVCNADARCGSGSARDCDDSVACTRDSCDEAADRCESTVSAGCLIDATCLPAGAENPANQCERCLPRVSRTRWSLEVGARCDDGLFCQTGETCRADGRCTAESSRSCDDGVPCTMDRCNEGADRCDSALSGGYCLIAGSCLAEGARRPGAQCEVCNPGGSPLSWSVSVGESCDDGLFCTLGERCLVDGSCGAGVANPCSDALSCTRDVCQEDLDRCFSVPEPSAGCLIDSACLAPGTPHPTDPCLACQPRVSPTRWSAAVGAACDDGSACTLADRCDSSGICAGTPLDCSRLEGPCVAAACDPGVGACVVTPLRAGTACDDGDGCTVAGRCDGAGRCEGVPRDCSALNTDCTEGFCGPSEDCETRPRSAGTVCNDSSLCTESDICDGAGGCRGTPVDCSAMATDCLGSACDPTTGRCTSSPAPLGTRCDDSDLCTNSDQCDGAGGCFGSPLDCSSLDSACTLGVCLPSGSCVALPTGEGTRCDDGNPCTTLDSCDAGATCEGTPTDCTGLCASSCAGSCEPVASAGSCSCLCV